MANNRAEKSGFAAEAQAKIDANFDADEANKCMEWIRQQGIEVPEFQPTIDGTHEILHDGMILSRLVDKLMPGKINWNDKTFQVPKIAGMKLMRERERIAAFTKNVQEYGISDTYTFPTESLTDKSNMTQVLICIRAIGIEAQSRGVAPADYWPKKTGKR